MEMMSWKNPGSGIMLPSGLPLIRRYTISHYWALTRGPSYMQGVHHLTEARWARLHHNRLPAFFGQSEATSSDEVITRVLN